MYYMNPMDIQFLSFPSCLFWAFSAAWFLVLSLVPCLTNCMFIIIINLMNHHLK